MDILLSVLGAIATETSRFLCSSFYHKIRGVIKFQSDVDALEMEMTTLVNLKNNFLRAIEMAERDRKSPTPEICEWLYKVAEIELQVSLLQTEISANKENLHGCCLNLSLRRKLSKQVKEKLKEVKQIINKGGSPAEAVFTDFQVKDVENLPGPSTVSQKKATENVDKVLGLLRDDKFGKIGIWGMGGVGKTTLVRNLNNELESSGAEQPFGVVIWVTVSKDSDTTRIQNRIAERLNMQINGRESADGLAIRLSDRLKKEKKFLLILDDVWERIDLDKVGVPRSEFHSGCKVILTTRFLDVCREMATDVEFPVLPLCDEEAWQLFSQSAGEVVNSEYIQPLAEDVAKECAGLPLAILTVGKAMKGKSKVELWKDALKALRWSNPMPSIKGIEKQVFLPLKLSYDSLEGTNIRPCFLYCCLYPEDHQIEINELIQCWVAEGLIGKKECLEDSYNGGITLIERLKDSCLLESGEEKGTVRMHDVIRDVAIWISSNLEDEQKFLVRAGMRLRQIPEVETWESLKRVSFMNNKIEALPDCVFGCSKVSTLLLQNNFLLNNVPERFLQDFEALRVLNLSSTDIASLPLSITRLCNLRALLLTNCFWFENFPELGRLIALETLDLSRTGIVTLPKNMKDLRNLKHLNLSSTNSLEIIEAGIFSELSSLEVLNMRGSVYMFVVHENADGGSATFEGGSATFEELKFLKHLSEIYVSINNVPCIAESAWWRKFRKFIIYIGCQDQLKVTHGERSLILNSVDLSRRTSEGMLNGLVSNANHLSLNMCEGLEDMCENIGDVGRNLQILEICGTLPQEKSWDNHLSLNMCECEGLEDMCEICGSLPQEKSWDNHLSLNMCEGLEDMCEICGSLPQEKSWDLVAKFPSLQVLKLSSLPKLRSVEMDWSCIREIKVEGCPALKRLHISSQHSKTIRLISGESKWWNQLESGNEPSLQQYFQPTD